MPTATPHLHLSHPSHSTISLPIRQKQIHAASFDCLLATHSTWSSRCRSSARPQCKMNPVKDSGRSSCQGSKRFQTAPGLDFVAHPRLTSSALTISLACRFSAVPRPHRLRLGTQAWISPRYPCVFAHYVSDGSLVRCST